MKTLTAVVISFLRPEYTRECVRSLKEQYPDIEILVAENGEHDKDLAKFVRSLGGKYFLMPFDSGVCYARNRLIELVQTDYVLVGDDDFFYDEHAKVEEMQAFLENHPEFDLIGGRIRERGVVKNFQGNIEIHDRHIEYKKIGDDEGGEIDETIGLRFQKCELVFNYFVARTESIRGIHWDEKIKVAYEHSDWFISLKKAGKNVAYTPDAIVIHKPGHVEVQDIGLYKAFRHRRTDKVRFFRKHGIDYYIGLNGAKARIDDDQVTRIGLRGALSAFIIDREYEQNGRTYMPGEIVWTTQPLPWMKPANIRESVRKSLRDRSKNANI